MPDPSNETRTEPSSRRVFLKAGLGGAGLAGAAVLATTLGRTDAAASTGAHTGHRMPSNAPDVPAHHALSMPGIVGEVDHDANGFDPTDILTDFDRGKVSTLPNGRTLREYQIVAQNKNVEVLPGIEFPAWTFNGRIPGPTIRAKEGDLLRITLLNAADHPHSMHFHGVHPGNMDGVFDRESGIVMPGEKFTYEFEAEPFGVHLYHCHVAPLAEHIARGLYGAFIIEPKDGWPKADHELIMVMSGYDLDFDGANDVYAVNGIPFHYDHNKHPIKLKVGELVRVFLINILEYDQINSFHLHAAFFNYYPTGTSRTPAEFTDTIMLAQGQRGILEFRYKYPGRYMFHAHKTEFAELGWTGVFEVEA